MSLANMFRFPLFLMDAFNFLHTSASLMHGVPHKAIFKVNSTIIKKRVFRDITVLIEGICRV